MNLFNVLAADETGLFKSAIRGFFAQIIKFLYKLFSWSIDMMYQLARFDFGMDGFIDSVAKKVFGILIIFMLFRLTLSFLTFIVDPETAFDGKKGIQNIIVKILLAIIILVFINPLFEVAKEVEKDILDSGVIESIVATNESGETIKIDDDVYGYGVHMSSLCNEGSYVYTFSKGDHIALLLLRPFIQPYSELELDNGDKFAKQQETINGENGEGEKTYYCGADIDGSEITYISGANNKEALKAAVKGPNSAEEFMYGDMYNMKNREDENTYMFDFNYIFATIAGFVAILITISFCFDVVIRSLTILFLKLIAPIPVISSINPKSSDNLTKWAKKMGATWASLFIRIIVLNFAILLITAVCDGLDSNGVQDVSLMMEIFLIIGILMFAKKLPKLLEEIIPGLKLGDGLELNPFKRVKKDALGGEALSNAVGRTTGLITGGIGGAISGAKAGGEVGNKKLGRVLGALSGANAGFQNKKWSLGKGMNEAYKNLTGNEFRRFSLANSILNNVGEGKVGETKDYIKRGYDKLNNLRTRLNISENRSAALAQSLLSRGIDVANADIERLQANIDSNISAQQALAGRLENERRTLDGQRSAAQTNYDSGRVAFENAKNIFDSEQSRFNEINNKINEKQNAYNSTTDRRVRIKLRQEIDDLERDKSSLESSMTTHRTDMQQAEANMNSLKTALDNVTNSYNSKIQELSNVQNEIQMLQNDKNSIKIYSKNRDNENQIRSDISALEKDIDTIKKEKGQSERFYRIDPAPQQDYAKSKDNIDSKYN